ncbi:MAG: hypothetical protein MHPSP_002513 [Paramarteilia canceri]
MAAFPNDNMNFHQQNGHKTSHTGINFGETFMTPQRPPINYQTPPNYLLSPLQNSPINSSLNTFYPQGNVVTRPNQYPMVAKNSISTFDSRYFNRNKPKIVRNAIKTFFCEICKISCSSESAHFAHLKGKQHLRKKKLQSSMESKSNSGNNIYCAVCSCSCSSLSAFDEHLKGRQHQLVLATLKKLNKPIPEQKTPSDNQKPPENVNEDLPGDKDLIGNEYIKINKEAVNSNEYITCSLCKCGFSSKIPWRTHMKGRRHLTAYQKLVDRSFNTNKNNDNKTTTKTFKADLASSFDSSSSTIDIKMNISIEENKIMFKFQNSSCLDIEHVLYFLNGRDLNKNHNVGIKILRSLWVQNNHCTSDEVCKTVRIMKMFLRENDEFLLISEWMLKVLIDCCAQKISSATRFMNTTPIVTSEKIIYTFFELLASGISINSKINSILPDPILSENQEVVSIFSELTLENSKSITEEALKVLNALKNDRVNDIFSIED